MLVRVLPRIIVQHCRCASTGLKDSEIAANHPPNRRLTIDDRGHEIWEGKNLQLPKRIAQLRFAHVPESMVDVLAAIREVERTFGRIREYRLMRDADRPSEYQAIVWTAFESPASFKLIPMTGVTLKISVPAQDKPEGGPGLNDILRLLEPQDRGRLDRTVISTGTEGEKSDGNQRVIDVEVRRTDGHEIRHRSTAKPPIRSRAMKAAMGHAFLDWGGFAPLQPLFETSPFTGLSQAPKAQESNMRLALNKWSQILDRPDPSFPEMLAKQETVATKEPPSSFIDEVENVMASASSQKSIPPSKNLPVGATQTGPSKDNWEPLKDYKVKPKRKSATPKPPSKQLDASQQPKKASVLDKAREFARLQAREQLLRKKGELEATPSSPSLKESFERTLRPRPDGDRPSSFGNGKATTEESGSKGFWRWF